MTVLVVLALPLVAASPGSAAPRKQKTWYVRAKAGSKGTGSRAAPFGSLARVQKASRPGDKIVILPVPRRVAPLNGGLRLKPRQRLIGAGPAVAGRTKKLKKLPAIRNTNGTKLAGDAIRLSRRTTVRNVVVTTAYRGAIYGRDTLGVKIAGNDISRQNTSCTDGFLVQPFNVPTGIPGFMVPASPALAPQNGWAGIMVDGRRATGKIKVVRNYVHDASCADGIDIRAMGSSKLTATVNGNTVTRLAQGEAGGGGGVIGSVLAIGMQSLDHAVLRVTQDRNTQTYIGSPDADCEGQFANTAGSGKIYETVNHNTFAHGIGGSSCNGFETIVSTGDGTIEVLLKNSTFRDNVGDMFEEGNLGAGSRMRFVVENVVVDGTSQRGDNPPGSSDGGDNPVPFNLGDCMVFGHNGGGNSTTFVMRNSVFRNCNNGISALSNVGQGNGSGPAKRLVLDIRHSVIANNAKYGVHSYFLTPMDQLHVRIADTRITGNGEPGASFETQGMGIGGVPDLKIDLGGGALGSAGGNCLFGNGSGDAEATNLPVVARRAWWGQAGGPKSGQTVTHGVGTVSSGGGLASRPACGPRK